MGRTGVRLLCAVLGLVLAAAPEPGRAVSSAPLGGLPLSFQESSVAVRLGSRYVRGEWGLFQEVDLDRQVCRLPEATVVVGVASHAGLFLEYAGILLREGSGPNLYGTGDLKVTGLFTLRDEDEAPALAFTLAAKLPDSNERTHFGTDSADIHVGGVLAGHVGGVALSAQLAIGILGHPTSPIPTQDDVLVYEVCAAGDLSEAWRLAVAAEGIAQSRFGNDRSVLQVGLIWRRGSTTFDVGATRGLASRSGDFGVAAGVTFDLGSWK